MFQNKFGEEINLGLKIYVKDSNFASQFFHFPKKLVTYVTLCVYCPSFYCRIRFYYVVDIVFLTLSSKGFKDHEPILQIKDVSDFM